MPREHGPVALIRQKRASSAAMIDIAAMGRLG